MKKFSLFQENVQEGEKITVVVQGEFGGVVAIQMTYIGSEAIAHYYNCPSDMYGGRLVFKPKGKRRAYETRIDYSVPLIVYKGYVNIDTESIVYRTCGNSKISRYGMHDPRYFTDVLKKYPNSVLFSDIPGEEAVKNDEN